jgi:dolichyl-phosphate-mannose--protein O-mannosyl transferase
MLRLEHLSTKKNLHSHHFSSPLSQNQEISAYGDNGTEHFEYLALIYSEIIPDKTQGRAQIFIIYTAHWLIDY